MEEHRLKTSQSTFSMCLGTLFKYRTLCKKVAWLTHTNTREGLFLSLLLTEWAAEKIFKGRKNHRSGMLSPVNTDFSRILMVDSHRYHTCAILHADYMWSVDIPRQACASIYI